MVDESVAEVQRQSVLTTISEEHRKQRKQAARRLAGWGWFAAGPNNSLIAARDAGNDEIYALDWEAP
jgi:hypothetical protein